jgi:hypothetical protein
MTVELLTQMDSLSFVLRSVSGDLVVGETKASKRLAVGSGAIQVRGATISGSLEFRF